MTEAEHTSKTLTDATASTITSVSRSLINALPSQFLVLVLLNIVFITVVLWFLDDQMTVRMHVLDKIVDRCIEIR